MLGVQSWCERVVEVREKIWHPVSHGACMECAADRTSFIVGSCGQIYDSFFYGSCEVTTVRLCCVQCGCVASDLFVQLSEA